MTLGDLGADVIKVESPARRRHAPLEAAGRRAGPRVLPPRREPQQALDRARPQASSPTSSSRGGCASAPTSSSRTSSPGRSSASGSATSASRREPAASSTARSAASASAGGRELPGYDPLVQAVGGLMSITGPPGTPSKAGVAIVDVVAALYATVAVLAALYARRELGGGQRVTVDLLHANLALLANQCDRAGSRAARCRVALGNVHPSIEPFATYRAARRRADDLAPATTGSSRGSPRRSARRSSPTTRASRRTSSGSRIATSCARARGAARDAHARRVARRAARSGRARRAGADDRRGVLARGGARPRRRRRDRTACAPSASPRAFETPAPRSAAARRTWTSTAADFRPRL